MIEKVLKLIDERNITANKVQVACGFGGNQIYMWKTGKAKPSMDAIIKIAKYFNVTTDYLLGIESTAGLLPTAPGIYITDKNGKTQYFNVTGERLKLLAELAEKMQTDEQRDLLVELAKTTERKQNNK